MSLSSLMKEPSAFLPVVMSGVALCIVFIHIALNGVARQADEGAAAHIFQILIVAQLPLVAFFAFKFLPRMPKEAAGVLAIQAAAGLAALAPVYLLHW